MEEGFSRAYRDLDRRMKIRAELDGDVYLPNPEPTAKVDYILVCMEPSLGHWSHSADEARARVASGFRNFLSDIEPILLHFSVRRFLCENGQRYHITDFSKGAMLVRRASARRTDRYDRWYELLQEEIDLIAAPGARVIAVGAAVAAHLRGREFPRRIWPVIHYSPLAGRARAGGLDGQEGRFREFAGSISANDILVTAHEVLDKSGVPPDIYKDAVERITKMKLSESRLKLIYQYKLAFEAMKTTCA